MIDSGRLAPGIGMTAGALASSQATVTRCGETPVRSGDLAERRVPVAQPPGPADAAERAPRQGRDARPCTVPSRLRCCPLTATPAAALGMPAAPGWLLR